MRSASPARLSTWGQDRRLSRDLGDRAARVARDDRAARLGLDDHPAELLDPGLGRPARDQRDVGAAVRRRQALGRLPGDELEAVGEPER